MSVKSSRSAFRVLDLLAAHKRPLEANFIAGSVEIPLTSTLRALSTLEEAGFAERERATGRFKLGRAANTLAFAFMSQFPVRDLALPYLQRLTLETGQTSTLFIRLGWHALRAAAVLGQRRLIHSMPVGQTRNLGVGAHGQAILAFLPPEEQERALARVGLRAAPEVSRHEETAGAEVFVAINPEEPGACDCAWPLYDAAQRVVASVGFEGVPDDLVNEMTAPGSPAVAIVEELAETCRRELTKQTSHYDHVPFDHIVVGEAVRN